MAATVSLTLGSGTSHLPAFSFRFCLMVLLRTFALSTCTGRRHHHCEWQLGGVMPNRRGQFALRSALAAAVPAVRSIRPDCNDMSTTRLCRRYRNRCLCVLAVVGIPQHKRKGRAGCNAGPADMRGQRMNPTSGQRATRQTCGNARFDTGWVNLCRMLYEAFRILVQGAAG